MAYPQGINFRNSAGYVTDGANEDHDTTSGTGADYPFTTVQGNTVGWETVVSVVQTRDRNSGNDRRLAGMGFQGNASDVNTFRFDLPSAGVYNIRFAGGDASYSQGCAYDLYDGVSLLVHLATGSTSAGNQFKDATNTEYSAAAWPGSNSTTTQTFGGTICRFTNIAGAAQMIAHVYVESGSISPPIGSINERSFYRGSNSREEN